MRQATSSVPVFDTTTAGFPVVILAGLDYADLVEAIIAEALADAKPKEPAA